MNDVVALSIMQADPTLPVPSHAHPGDAGLDLRASASVVVPVHGRTEVGTGVAVAIPDGYCGFVLPRSGLAFKFGLTLSNSPGLIDSGFRGEIRCSLSNLGTTPVTIEHGDRIAQLVIVPFAHCLIRPVNELPESVRGRNGYGSTGVK